MNVVCYYVTVIIIATYCNVCLFFVVLIYFDRFVRHVPELHQRGPEGGRDDRRQQSVHHLHVPGTVPTRNLSHTLMNYSL